MVTHKGLVIDLEGNNLTTLPEEITKLERVQWELSGNPFFCTCDNLWMKEWLINANASRNVVLDYRKAICHGGKFDRRPVIELEADEMGCVPHVLAREAIITIACLLSIGLIIFCVAAVVFKRWNEVRWIIYKKANRFIAKGGRIEDLEETVFDAFIAYR